MCHACLEGEEGAAVAAVTFPDTGTLSRELATTEYDHCYDTVSGKAGERGRVIGGLSVTSNAPVWEHHSLQPQNLLAAMF